MAKYEVAFVKRETIFTRYYMTVEADSSEAAMRKVESFNTTPEEESTLEEGKCLGMGDSYFDSVDWANIVKEREDA